MIARHAILFAFAVSGLAACGGGSSLTKLQVTPEQRAANSAARCLLGPFVRNADGSITNEQVQAGIDASFAAADLNSDGKLNYEEINRTNQLRQGTCDSTSLVSWDGTGTIGRQEYGARYETAFISADRDGDSLATAYELANPVSATERAVAEYKRANERKATAQGAKTDDTPTGMPARNSGTLGPSGPPGY